MLSVTSFNSFNAFKCEIGIQIKVMMDLELESSHKNNVGIISSITVTKLNRLGKMSAEI